MPMIHERSPDTDAVAVVLRGCNDEISYNDLAMLAGLSLKRVKEVLVSARRILRSEDKVLFGVIRGVGLKRLGDKDRVVKPEAFKKRVRRGSRRELQDLAGIQHFDILTKAEQHSVSTNRTVLNVLMQQASVKPEPPTDRRLTPAPEADLSGLIKKK